MKIELTLNEEYGTVSIKMLTLPNEPKPKEGYDEYFETERVRKILYIYEIALASLINVLNPRVEKKIVSDSFKLFVGKFLKA